MNFRKLFTVISALTLLATNIYAQYYTLGNDPYKKWRQIHTEHYKIVYPAEIDSLARVFAANIESVRSEVMRPLDIDPAPISVILHSFSAKSNGSVAWAPKRVDMYTTPAMYNYMAEPWVYDLSLHESRHVGQMESFKKGGFFRIGSYIIGQQMFGIGAALWPSKQFLEGDATAAETELSRGGRGRKAEFLQYFRTALLSGDTRSVDKWKLGSFRHYTPDNYLMGYLITSNYKAYTGEYDFPGKFMEVKACTPFTKGIVGSRDTVPAGAFGDHIVNLAINNMHQLWIEDDIKRGEKTVITDSLLSKVPKYYTNYVSPVLDSKQASVYAIRSGMANSPELVKIDPETKKIKVIRQFSSYYSKLSEKNGVLYWSETVNAGPWKLLDYSEIHSYNTLTGSSKAVTSKTRYFYPAPSTTGDTIAVAEIPFEGSSFLTLIDSYGRPLDVRVETPEKGSIKEIAWLGNRAYCLIVTNDGLGLYSTSFKDGWKIEIAPQYQNIRSLREAVLDIDGPATQCLIFTSDTDKLDNIYCYIPESSETLKLTNSKFGADYPYATPDGGLLYSNFGHYGYFPAFSSSDNLEYKSADMANPIEQPIAAINSDLAGRAYPKPSEKMLSDYADESNYPSLKYNKFGHLFNVHSWAPIYLNPDPVLEGSFSRLHDVASLGVTALSQNELGTAKASLAYSWATGTYSKERRHAGHFSFDYTGLIPNIQVKFHLNSEFRSALVYFADSTGTPTIGRADISDQGIHLAGSVRLYENFLFDSDGWYRTLSPFLQFNWNNNKAIDNFRKITGNTNYIYGGITYSQVTAKSAAMIYPKFGFGGSFRVLTPLSLSSPTMHSTQFSLSAYGYIPGFAQNHGIKLTLNGAIENRKNGLGVFSVGTLVSLPRGYTISYDRLNSSRYLLGTIDYAFGIYLGDVSLGPVLYLKRLQVIPFVDGAINRIYKGGTEAIGSFGTDLMLDFCVIRKQFKLSAGVRYAHTAKYEDIGQNFFKFLFNIGL